MQIIRVISTPEGQAPEEIRKAWIGVVIPVDESFEQPSLQETGGVIVRGEKPIPKHVYTVGAIDAFNALFENNAEACGWWYENVSQLFKEGMHLLFNEAACELIED